jgi:hypothetical protein
VLRKSQTVKPEYKNVVETVCQLMRSRQRECVVDWIGPQDCTAFAHRSGDNDSEFKIMMSFESDGISFGVSSIYQGAENTECSGFKVDWEEEGSMDQIRTILHTMITSVSKV